MKPFQTYQNAVDALETMCPISGWQKKVDHGPSISPRIQKSISLSSDYKKRWSAWFACVDHLPKPWPSEEITKVLHFHLPGKKSEAMSWCDTKSGLELLDKVLKLGADPTVFVRSSHSTLLGFAAYAGYVEATKLLLDYTQTPASRLLLDETHLSSSSANYEEVLYSTLLHRLVSRASKSNEVVDIIDAICAHDPDAILAQTFKKRCPHQVAVKSLKPLLKQRYDHRQAVLQNQRIQQQLGDCAVESTAKARKI